MPDEALFSMAGPSLGKRKESGTSPNGTGGRFSGAESAALLPASRRVDWRFLLPDPRLGAVICLKPAPQSLIESLQIFSTSLAVVTPAGEGHEPVEASYDLAVACDPAQRAVTRAMQYVRSGGFIYLEIHNLSSLLRRSTRSKARAALRNNGFRRPRYYTRLLQSAGFEDVHLYWHWPDFETCKMIIPLDDPGAARFALARGGWGLKAQLSRVFARLLTAGGPGGEMLSSSTLLAWIAPCCSVLARRSVS